MSIGARSCSNCIFSIALVAVCLAVGTARAQGTGTAEDPWLVGHEDNEGGVESVIAVLDEDGTLTISGTGAMMGFGWTYQPWDSSRSGIIRILIDGGVTSIGQYAFYNCSNLKSVTISGSVTSIGDYAFVNNTSRLISVTSLNPVPPTIQSYAFNDFYRLNVPEESFWDYYNANNWSSFQIINGKRTWFVGHPDNDGGVESVMAVLYDNGTLTISGNGATSANKDNYNRWPWSNTNFGPLITEVIIENGVTDIGIGAFDNGGSSLYDNITSVTIPNSVTSIGVSAFAHCKGLKQIVIPSSVKSIEMSAFVGTSLKSVTIPDGVESIANFAFGYCQNLTSVSIPVNTSILSNSVFQECNKLASVTFRGSGPMADWSNYGPWSTSNIQDIIIGDGVTHIGNYTFRGLGNLKSITLPSSVTSIGEGAFRQTGLASVTLPENVTSVGENAFLQCEALKTVSSMNPVPPTIFENSFGSNFGGDFYVPDESVDAYSKAPIWQDFNCIKPLSKVSILTPDRNIPNVAPNKDAAVIAPLSAISFDLTVGPNPVQKSSGAVKIFAQGKTFASGKLTVYDATGNVVRKIDVRDNGIRSESDNRRAVGVWDLRDAKGCAVSEGAYLVRGTVKTVDGKRERVSAVVSVR